MPSTPGPIYHWARVPHIGASITSMEGDTSNRNEQEPRQGSWLNRESAGKSSSTVPRQARTMNSTIEVPNRHDPAMERNSNASLSSGDHADGDQSVVSIPQGLSRTSIE